MGNRTNYGTGRMTVDNRQKNERSRSGNPYSSHVKAGKHAGTVYNFKRKSRIRKSLTRLPILLEFIHKYIFLNFVSFYNGLNSNTSSTTLPVSSPLLLRNPPNTFAFIPLPAMSLSSLNRSNSKTFRHIMPYSAPVCEGMHYHKTGVPWQINSIFIMP